MDKYKYHSTLAGELSILGALVGSVLINKYTPEIAQSLGGRDLMRIVTDPETCIVPKWIFRGVGFLIGGVSSYGVGRVIDIYRNNKKAREDNEIMSQNKIFTPEKIHARLSGDMNYDNMESGVNKDLSTNARRGAVYKKKLRTIGIKRR